MRAADPIRVPFGAVDALILAASIAVGIVCATVDQKDLEAALGLGNTQSRFEAQLKSAREEVRSDGAAGAGERLVDRVVRWHATAVIFGVRALPFLTVGCGLTIFRHRAARSRRALRRTGILTAAVAASMTAVCLANEFVLRRFPTLQIGYSHNVFVSLWHQMGIELGFALLALWAVFAAARRWRCDRGWADRLGRALGGVWVYYAVTREVLVPLFS